MKANDDVMKELERLLAIRWAFNDTRLNSHVALVREYLRRAALWAKVLEGVDRWPFFDVAACISPEVRADPHSVGILQSALPGKSFTFTINKTCLWDLHWHNLKSLLPDRVGNYNLPDPYEPLVHLYERGGTFHTEHGFIDVFTVGIPYKYRSCQAYQAATPLAASDDDALDRLDHPLPV